jgi:hypothetical protein
MSMSTDPEFLNVVGLGRRGMRIDFAVSTVLPIPISIPGRGTGPRGLGGCGSRSLIPACVSSAHSIVSTSPSRGMFSCTSLRYRSLGLALSKAV